jgi:hypothetical protein
MLTSSPYLIIKLFSLISFCIKIISKLKKINSILKKKNLQAALKICSSLKCFEFLKMIKRITRINFFKSIVLSKPFSYKYYHYHFVHAYNTKDNCLLYSMVYDSYIVKKIRNKVRLKVLSFEKLF